MSDSEEDNISVLIICAYPKKYRLVMKQLSRDGWGVACISNVKKALQMMLTDPPTHVFVSYNVKGISVLKVATIIHSTFKLPVILFPEEHDYQTNRMMREVTWNNKLSARISATSIRTKIKQMMGPSQSAASLAEKNKPQIQRFSRDDEGLVSKQKTRHQEEEAISYSASVKKRAKRPFEDEYEDEEEGFASPYQKKRKPRAVSGENDYEDEWVDSEEEFYSEEEQALQSKSKKSRRRASGVSDHEDIYDEEEFYEESYEDDEEWGDEEAINGESSSKTKSRKKRKNQNEENSFGEEAEDGEEEFYEDSHEVGEDWSSDEQQVRKVKRKRKKRPKSFETGAADYEDYEEDDEFEKPREAGRLKKKSEFTYDGEEDSTSSYGRKKRQAKIIVEDDEPDYDDFISEGDIDYDGSEVEDDSLDEILDKFDDEGKELSNDEIQKRKKSRSSTIEKEDSLLSSTKKKKKVSSYAEDDEFYEDEEDSTFDSHFNKKKNVNELSDRGSEKGEEDIEDNDSAYSQGKKKKLKLVKEDNEEDEDVFYDSESEMDEAEISAKKSSAKDELDKLMDAIDSTFKSAMAPDEEVMNVVDESSCITVFYVEGKEYNGLIYLSSAEEVNLDQELMGKLSEKLGDNFKDSGLDISIHNPINIQTSGVDFKHWMDENCDYSCTTNHHGNEVAVGLLIDFQFKQPVSSSTVDDMHSIEVKKIPSNKALDFDLFIYLPTNKKHIKYVANGGKLDKNQKGKLIQKNMDNFMIKNKDLAKVQDYFIQIYAKKKISA